MATLTPPVAWPQRASGLNPPRSLPAQLVAGAAVESHLVPDHERYSCLIGASELAVPEANSARPALC